MARSDIFSDADLTNDTNEADEADGFADAVDTGLGEDDTEYDEGVGTEYNDEADEAEADEADEADEAEADEVDETEADETEVDETDDIEEVQVAFDETVDRFVAAVEEAVEIGKVEPNYTVPEEKLAAASEAYDNILGGQKYRNKAKKFLQDHMQLSLLPGTLDFARASTLSQLTEYINSTATRRTPPPEPVDPSKAYAEKAVVLDLARKIHDASVPNNADTWEEEYANLMTEELVSEALSLYAWEKLPSGDRENTERPTASPLADLAVKLIQGKAVAKAARKAKVGGVSTKTISYTGPRRDVAAHIINAFSGVASGAFLTIGEIRATRSDEYGDDLPSAGAISARLGLGKEGGSKNPVPGVTPGQNAEGRNGAYKV